MPSRQTVHFVPTGGSLSVRVASGFAEPGSYSLDVLEQDETTVATQFRANFGSAAQNTHQIPGTAAQSDGRVLDLVASVGLLDATGAFAVHLTVLQDGTQLGTASDVGTATGLTHTSELIVALSGVAAVAETRGALPTPSLAVAADERISSRAERQAEVDRAAQAAVRESRAPRGKRGSKKRPGKKSASKTSKKRPAKAASKKKTRKRSR